MSVTTVSPASTAAANTTRRKDTLEPQDFFNLFITQMKYRRYRPSRTRPA